MQSRSSTAVQLARVCESAMARTYGRVSWSPSLQATSGSEPAALVVADTIGVQIQLLSDAGYSFPTAVRRIDHRYSDVGDVSLPTLTTAGFVVAKLTAWSDRRAPRDLYDLWALADAGLFSADAIALYRQIGPTGARPRLSDYDEVPSALEWGTALSHQCRIRVNPQDAADVVRRALLA